MYMVDLTVVNPKQPANNDIVPGGAAKEAATKKLKLYRSEFDIPADQVVPFALETFGRYDAAAEQFVQAIAKQTSAGAPSGAAYATSVQRMYERLSVALQRGNINMMARFEAACLGRGHN